MKPVIKITFHLWLGLTFLVIASLITIYLRNGQEGINLFIQQWPLSNLHITLASTYLTWLLLGILIYLLALEKIHENKVLNVVPSLFILMTLTSPKLFISNV